MANIIPFAFRGELFSGTHDFANGGNSFKIALYTGNPYSTSSTAYTTAQEVSASNTGYTTGGKVLASQAVASGTAVASVTLLIQHYLVLHLLQHLQLFTMIPTQINYVLY